MGFNSIEELRANREWHFKKVKEMFEKLDVFVFTFGLTEAWVSTHDGAVYPVCPGVAGGEFDQKKYQFINFSVEEIIKDFEIFILYLKSVNPEAKVILTVSPVPLVATASDNHVLVATTYSKAVLRVAAEQICSKYEDVAYFPSYEIITGNYSRGNYYANDLRSITEEGVSHVMRLFLLHYAELTSNSCVESSGNENGLYQDFQKNMQDLVEVNCEEILYSPATSDLK
jgi:hypothetical protein